MASDILRQVYENILSEYLNPNSILLDIGAKDGVIASQLSKQFGCDSISLDINFSLGDQLETSPVKADGAQLPFRASTVDAVISNMTFEHIPDVEPFVSEISRVLKPGGKFVVIFPNRIWPIDGHGFPPGTPWLPRKIGLRIFSRIGKRGEYYERFMHPVSSTGVRQVLSQHFAHVSFESNRLLDTDLEGGWKPNALRVFSSLLSHAFSKPVLRSMTELLFPIPIYLAEKANNEQRAHATG